MRGIKQWLGRGFFRPSLSGMLYLVLSFNGLHVQAESTPKYRAIDSMITEGFISASFVSLGGYQDNCAEASIENRTDDPKRISGKFNY